MPNRLVATLLVLAAALPGVAPFAVADSAIVQRHVPDAALVGEGRLKVMFWAVYDARLFATTGRLDRDAPFALEIDYLRDVDGADIADASVEEIATQGGHDAATLARWRKTLTAIFPDVTADTVLTGVRDARGHTLLFDGEALLGAVDDPAFTRAFFDIWLGERTSRPALRERLLAGHAE